MGRRPARLAEEFREEIAKIIDGELKDPRIGWTSVTRVELTGDLRYARVYVSTLGPEEDRKKTLTGLKQAAGYVRRALSARIRMRQVPEIAFVYDHGLEATERVARLLDDVKAEAAAAEEAPPGEPAPPDDREDG